MSVQELKMYAFGFRGMIWGAKRKKHHRISPN